MVKSTINAYNQRLAELMIQDFEKEVTLMLPHSGQKVCDDFGKRVQEFHKRHCQQSIGKQA